MLPRRAQRIADKLAAYGPKLTPRRILNLAANRLAFQRQTPQLRTMPSILMFEPTNRCNLQCPLCPTGSGRLTRPRGFADPAAVGRVIDEIAPYALKIVFMGYGEPFLHRELTAMIRHATDRRLLTSVSTNGMFLRTEADAERIVESGLSEILICLDGATQESLTKYRRNAVLEDILSGMRLLVEAKRRRRARWLVVNLQFIAMKHNESEIPLVRRIARDLGVDRLLVKSVATLGTADGSDDYLPSDPSRRRKRFDSAAPATRKCYFPWRMMIIDWNGTVVPCCYDADETVPLGNAFEPGGARAAWQGERYADFRRRVATERATIPLCRNCLALSRDETLL